MISLPFAVSLRLVTITFADVGSFMLMIYSIITLTALRFPLIAKRRRFIIILYAAAQANGCIYTFLKGIETSIRKAIHSLLPMSNAHINVRTMYRSG